MLYIDTPTRPEFRLLNRIRADACVSIYLKTSPVTQNTDQSRIELSNLARAAKDQLEAVDFDKRRLSALLEHIDDLIEDDEFWRLQANSLAVLATPETVRTYRLANDLTNTVQVSDRFHLKPLLRAITFPQSAFVLALSENSVRLIEVFSDLPPVSISVDNLPKDAASAIGKSSLKDRAPVRRIQGLEGKNVRLRQFVRRVDAALRPVLAGRETPLILAATGRLSHVYGEVNSYSHLLGDRIDDSPDRLSEAELAAAARPLLDTHYREEVEKLRSLYEVRANHGRATTDLAAAARAATYGAVDSLLVDIDSVLPGTIDDETGAVTFADEESASTYGLVDEIAGRALETDARVLGVRKADLPGEGVLAAILRFAV